MSPNSSETAWNFQTPFYRMDAGRLKMVYVYFHKPTLPRDFSMTIYYIWLVKLKNCLKTPKKSPSCLITYFIYLANSDSIETNTHFYTGITFLCKGLWNFDIPWGTSNFDHAETLTALKHKPCRRATCPEGPQTSTAPKHRPRRIRLSYIKKKFLPNFMSMNYLI